MLVDSHCHLDFPDVATELDEVVGRATALGVARLVTISTRVKRHKELLAPFGLDASDPAFWDKGLGVISGFVDELEKL